VCDPRRSPLNPETATFIYQPSAWLVAEGERVRVQEVSRQQVSPLALISNKTLNLLPVHEPSAWLVAEGERVRVQEVSRQQVSPLALVTGGASAAATGPAAMLGLLQVRRQLRHETGRMMVFHCRTCLPWRQCDNALDFAPDYNFCFSQVCLDSMPS
jgi:hypothetical protein